MAINPRTLNLTWRPPLAEDRNGQIFKYTVNLTDIDGGEVTHFLIEELTSSLIIPNLHPHYIYNYSVTALTLTGNGPYSPTVSIQMPQDGMILFY